METSQVLGIVMYQGVPKLVEIIAITGKRAKIRRPDAPATGEIRSLPVSEIYEYDETVWTQLQDYIRRIENNKVKIHEASRTLKPLMASLQAKAGGVGDDFWS